MAPSKMTVTKKPTQATRFLMAGENVDLTLLRAIAETRARMHAKDSTSRPLADDRELVGLLGERIFSVWSGLPMDIGVRHQGDGQLNFLSPSGNTVHVATYRKPVHLLREVSRTGTANIHVLAQVNADLTDATLLGWEYDYIMLLCPKRLLPGHKVLNHVMLAQDLRPMADLRQILYTIDAPLPVDERSAETRDNT